MDLHKRCEIVGPRRFKYTYLYKYSDNFFCDIQLITFKMSLNHKGDQTEENIDECLSKTYQPAVLHDVGFEVVETWQRHNTAPTWAEGL